jgi:hypothetical protein
MDLLDLAIFVLRLLVVALLYIFLAAVLRLSTRGLRTTPAGPPRLQPPAVIGDDARASRLQLVVLEAGGSSLKPGQVLELTDGAVLGRAETAQVRLLDVAVSSQHARISRVGRAWVLSDCKLVTCSRWATCGCRSARAKPETAPYWNPA